MEKLNCVNPEFDKKEKDYVVSYNRRDIKAINERINSTINASDIIFICPKKTVDFDSLGAAVGMTKICESLGKNSYIIIDDKFENNKKGIGKFLCEMRTKFNVISSSEAEKIISENDTLLIVDSNSSDKTSMEENIDKYKNIIVIDHHRKENNSIDTKNSFILDDISSTCEIITYLLLENEIEITPDMANYLLAGIVLDTQNYSRNTSPSTMFTSAILCVKGANQLEVKKMFDDSFDRYKSVHELTNQAKFNDNYVIASIFDRVFKVEDIDRAAEGLIDFGVDASFALGYINVNTISISAKSNGNVNVEDIMEKIGGSGNKYSATAQVKEKSILEMIEFVQNSMKEINGEIVLVEKI